MSVAYLPRVTETVRPGGSSHRMFDVIVVATDGSEPAEAAAQLGLDLAGAFDAAVHVVSVVDTGPLGDHRLPGDEASAAEALGERATTLVERLAHRATERGLTTTSATPSGTAAVEIVDYAESVDADLVVLGTRGRTGVDRVVLGSVAERVVRSSSVPVLVDGGA